MTRKTPGEEYVALYKAGNCQPIGIVRKSEADQLLKDLPSRSYWTLPNITSVNAQKIIKGAKKCTRDSKESDGIEKYISF